jgi:hypothetical protein
VKNLLLKLKESAFAVLPITAIVLIMAIAVGGIRGDIIWQYLISAVMLIIGMGLFSLGAEVAMVPMGEAIGSKIISLKKLFTILLICFIMGFLITISEPDLMVLADLLAKILNRYILIACVGIGVGIFMIFAVLRVIFNIKLRTLLIISYAIVFVLAIFVPAEFLPLAFDSGGVTTGPMTVPFIMALGIGFASKKGGSDMEDSFGWVALGSVGPIIAVMVMGLFADTSSIGANAFTPPSTTVESGLFSNFLKAFPTFFSEVAIALLPILAFILVFNFISLKLNKKTLFRIIIGIIYVYVGLVLFLTGVNAGFAPVGMLLGKVIVEKGWAWLLVPLGMLVGFFIVIAEPAVHVLGAQVEEISGGTIKKRSIYFSLMLGISVSIGLAMVRVVTGISIWWLLIPGYAISVVLTFIVPKVFTAIAFDSGGVASGPMTTTFLLPFAVGGVMTTGGNILTDAFGIVAMVAMTPLITLQILGLISAVKTKRLKSAEVIPEDIIVLDDEESVVTLSDNSKADAKSEKGKAQHKAATKTKKASQSQTAPDADGEKPAE